MHSDATWLANYNHGRDSYQQWWRNLYTKHRGLFKFSGYNCMVHSYEVIAKSKRLNPPCPPYSTAYGYQVIIKSVHYLPFGKFSDIRTYMYIILFKQMKCLTGESKAAGRDVVDIKRLPN